MRQGAMTLGRLAIGRWPIIVLSLAGMLSNALCSTAHAGTYEVLECNPAHNGAAADVSFGFAPPRGGQPYGYGHWVDCSAGSSTGVAVNLYGSYVWPGDEAAWSFEAPAGTVFQSGIFEYSTTSDGGAGNVITLYDPSGAALTTRSSSSGQASFGSTAAKRLAGGLYCPSGAGYYCFGSDADLVWLRNLDLTLLDGVAPQFSLGGSVLDGAIQRGSETLAIAATDVGGGPRQATVAVNGSQAASALNSGCDYTPTGFLARFVPCPAATFNLELDTQRAPWRDGSNSLQVCVDDVATGASQPGRTCSARVVNVDNSCPDSQGAAGRATALQAGFRNEAGDVRPSISVTSNQGATLRGGLTGPDGPVGGATVCVYEQIDAPAEIRQLVQVTKTRTDGSFTAYAPAGPSRNFDLFYRYNNASIEKGQLHLDSGAVPTLRLGPKGGVANGKAARFSGTIPQPRAAGRAVTLQARAGRKWRTFKQLTTDREGRFRGKYRFTQTHGLAAYRFRVVVKKQDGYPYSPGTSRVRKITVRG